MQQGEFVSLTPAAQIPLLFASQGQEQNDVLSMFCDHYESNHQTTLAQWLQDNHDQAEEFYALIIKVTEATLFARTAKISARLDGLDLYQQKFCEAGGVSRLVAGLNEFPNDPTLVTNTFKTLGFLAINPNIRENIIPREGVLESAIKALEVYQNAPLVTIHILAALVNFFSQSVINKQIFFNEGGIQKLFPAILEAPSSAPLARIICKLFHNLCSTKIELRLYIISVGLIPRLVEIASAHINDACVAENVVWVFLNLTLNSRDAKGDLKQQGGIPILFQMIETHSKNATIIYLVLALLNQISSRTTTRVVVASQGAIKIVLELLEQWQNNSSIQLLCLKTLDILCTLSSCRKRLAEEDRLPKFITWLIGQMENRSCVQVGLDICSKLSISSGDSRRALVSSGGNSLFTAINSSYPHDQNLIDQCDQCATSLGEPPDYENESSDEEVCSSDYEEGSGSGDEGDY